MLLVSFGGFWKYWQLYHKVTFDGPNKMIIVNPGVNSINVKTDLYSDWKEWIQLEDYSKYLPALRTTGGDPTGVGSYSGDIYFLINGWRLQVDHSCFIDGVLYSDDYPSPFIQVTGTQIVTNKVSSLVQTVAPQITGITVPTVQEIRTEMDVNSTKLTAIDNKVQTLNAAPTVSAIADQVRTELTPELAHLMTLNNTGLTPTQTTMILEMYELLGLDPTKPLIVTNNSRTAGTISQNIITDANQTTVTRV